jgi:hypothetical protein
MSQTEHIAFEPVSGPYDAVLLTHARRHTSDYDTAVRVVKETFDHFRTRKADSESWWEMLDYIDARLREDKPHV